MKSSDSPLFEPVLWDGSGFKILDETLLPERIEYIQVTDVSTALSAVKEMKTRAFGQVLTFLYSAALLARQYQGDAPSFLREKMALMTEQFCAVRPTFDFKGLGNFFPQWFAALPQPCRLRRGNAANGCAGIHSYRNASMGSSCDALRAG